MKKKKMMEQTVRNFSSTFVSVIIGLKASQLHRFVCLQWIQLGMQFVQWTTSTQINKLRFVYCASWHEYCEREVICSVWFKIENSQWRNEAKYQITTETKKKKKIIVFRCCCTYKKRNIGFFGCMCLLFERISATMTMKRLSFRTFQFQQENNVSSQTKPNQTKPIGTSMHRQCENVSEPNDTANLLNVSHVFVSEEFSFYFIFVFIFLHLSLFSCFFFHLIWAIIFSKDLFLIGPMRRPNILILNIIELKYELWQMTIKSLCFPISGSTNNGHTNESSSLWLDIAIIFIFIRRSQVFVSFCSVLL